MRRDQHFRVQPRTCADLHPIRLRSRIEGGEVRNVVTEQYDEFYCVRAYMKPNAKGEHETPPYHGTMSWAQNRFCDGISMSGGFKDKIT